MRDYASLLQKLIWDQLTETKEMFSMRTIAGFLSISNSNPVEPLPPAQFWSNLPNSILPRRVCTHHAPPPHRPGTPGCIFSPRCVNPWRSCLIIHFLVKRSRIYEKYMRFCKQNFFENGAVLHEHPLCLPYLPFVAMLPPSSSF